ncbi:UNVERIFIED_CONTAM: hypothetical protein GTU68_048067 [Idotea baltica]|nr:hypothetical protein [Idotea baltica]MCL4162693.1 hypothetical protein [Idotea baltica]
MIEADPDNFKLVQKKERKAWTISACLSIVPYPTEVSKL